MSTHSQDTIVKDPFFSAMPAYFDMTFDELLAAKSPSAWPEFERGLISEETMLTSFFKDRRPVDGHGLKKVMQDGYDWVEGMESVLSDLFEAGYQTHALSNYPMWFQMIEGKLQLSDYLQWTFVSCEGPMKGLRKPEKEAYLRVIDELKVAPSDIIFVDDRLVNVRSSIECGIDGIHFINAVSLREQLRMRGLEI